MSILKVSFRQNLTDVKKKKRLEVGKRNDKK